MFRLIVACLLALPTATLAQDVVFSPSDSIDCQQNGGLANECVGLSANMCMDASAGGYSTVGMNACLDKEVALWDGQLNDLYGQVLAQERALDAEMAGDAPHRPSGEALLRDMQRSWIVYRDATCNYEISSWYGGSGAGTAWLSCLMRLTGEQAFYLRSQLVDM